MSKNPDFRSFDFGYVSAEDELTENPSLLLDGFWDSDGVYKAATSSQKFLFLGGKGTGKTALLNHIYLRNDRIHDKFVSKRNFEDFSFTNFSKIVRGGIEPEAKYPDAWGWILSILAIQSLSKDSGCIIDDFEHYRQLSASLNEMGLMEDSSLKNIALKTSKRNFKLSIPKIFTYEKEYTGVDSPNDIPGFVNCCKNVLKKISTKSNHYILIDGLDDILSSRSVQYKSLSAFIEEVSRFNDFFRSNCVNLKFIVVCRTDIFDELSTANLNKIKQSKAHLLDWHQDRRRPTESDLVKLAILRSEHAVFDRYFRERIEGRGAIEWLIAQTRHTPRDFLRLLSFLQRASKMDERPLDRDTILSGAANYSREYFYNEVIDELAGSTENLRPVDCVRVLAKIDGKEFAYTKFKSALQDQGASEELCLRVGRRLFDCGALGIVKRDFNGQKRYGQKFINKDEDIYEDSDLIIHFGLQKALNKV